MTALRTRVDIILVLDLDGQAVRYGFHTTLRDQLELTKRFKDVDKDLTAAAPKLVYVAAQRAVTADPDHPHDLTGWSFDQFVDAVLDLSIEEPPPLT